MGRDISSLALFLCHRFDLSGDVIIFRMYDILIQINKSLTHSKVKPISVCNLQYI